MTEWTHTAAGDGVVLRAGDNWIRLRPRVHASRSVGALVEATLATLDTPDRIVHETPREVITPEGELAVVGGARCTSRGRERECTVAIVGAEPALCVQALGEPAVARDRALALASELGLGLGALRRRWFRYDPPPGWFGIRRPGVTVWLHPEHPRVPACAHVFDARPFLPADVDRFDRHVLFAMHDEFVPREDSTVGELRSELGLAGRQRTVAGTRGGIELVRIAVACADDRFVYMAHFEGVHDAAVLAAVRRMFRSFRPLPHGRPKLDAFAMWDV